VATGARALGVGRRHQGGRAKVTVSVSSHVPKPHTPFQWCALDPPSELRRKQGLLEADARLAKVDLKTHSVDESVLEAIFARGDRSLADVIEHAWRNGARFDSWEDQLKLDVWGAAFEKVGIDTSIFVGTIPVTARLPWDHIDVGLAGGFLAKEYRKALKNRLSPPCGKTIGSFVHYTNVEAAEADKRPLVCYDCGVVCDLSQMRTERIEFLAKMGAVRRPDRPLPIVTGDPPPRPKARRVPAQRPPGSTPLRYRFRFEKIGPMALLGHLDLVHAGKHCQRRRRAVAIDDAQGFHPRPDLGFSPALSLGVSSPPSTST
jgi:hypothetical protein